MTRKVPQAGVLRALFARSGNQCAFPECCHPLINDKNQFIAQVCHIEAASEGGDRYNPNTNDEQRRCYENLVIFCYRHHIETDDVDEFPAERLYRIKKDHEQKFINNDFNIDDAELCRISLQMDAYWSEIDRKNNFEHLYLNSGLAMKVNGGDDFFNVMKSVCDSVVGIKNMLNIFHDSDESLMRDLESLLIRKNISPGIFNDIPYTENPFVNRNWDFHNLGRENWIKRLEIDIVHLKVKYLEEYIKNHGDDLKAKGVLEKEMSLLEMYATSAIHID